MENQLVPVAPTLINVPYPRRNDLPIQRVIGRRYGPYQCPKCVRVFPTSQALAGHMRAHYRAAANPITRPMRRRPSRPTRFSTSQAFAGHTRAHYRSARYPIPTPMRRSSRLTSTVYLCLVNPRFRPTVTPWSPNFLGPRPCIPSIAHYLCGGGANGGTIFNAGAIAGPSQAAVGRSRIGCWTPQNMVTMHGPRDVMIMQEARNANMGSRQVDGVVIKQDPPHEVENIVEKESVEEHQVPFVDYFTKEECFPVELVGEEYLDLSLKL